MPQIEFRENKVLKLTNVLSRKVPEKELLNQDKQIMICKRRCAKFRAAALIFKRSEIDL